MSGWADLVLRGQPRLMDYEFEVTEGKDWGFALEDFTDGAGTAIDMSAATFVCEALTDVDGAVVATWTVTGDASGNLTGVLSDASTAGLATGATRFKPRQILWYCEGTLAGAVVQFWGPANSPFLIWGE
ncbi:hypothetical protein [Jatrophihabitans sp.]|uniref:hypothetical protein n=1 Tax=Jatrophihabitans sp. TaxID=1932789 RepID=UPI0030C66516|nr:hypothetical protein [Jatrophihabitans sp.]